MTSKIAFVLDGGFVRQKLKSKLSRLVSADDIVNLCDLLGQHQEIKNYDLYRVFYYDAEPLSGMATHPISRDKIDFGVTPTARTMRQLLDQLEMKRKFALRKGRLQHQGWKLAQSAERKLSPSTSTISSDQIVPNIKQKGVDQRIGLDIAWIAMKSLVDAILLVTGDSDFVPIMKFARREGITVLLYTFDHGVVRDLKAHADIIVPDNEIKISAG